MNTMIVELKLDCYHTGSQHKLFLNRPIPAQCLMVYLEVKAAISRMKAACYLHDKQPLWKCRAIQKLKIGLKFNNNYVIGLLSLFLSPNSRTMLGEMSCGY